MGETSTNIATLNMDDALKVRVKDGCDVEDPCASSPCPQHSRCLDAWDSYTCVCDKGGAAAPAPPSLRLSVGVAPEVSKTHRAKLSGASASPPALVGAGSPWPWAPSSRSAPRPCPFSVDASETPGLLPQEGGRNHARFKKSTFRVRPCTPSCRSHSQLAPVTLVCRGGRHPLPRGSRPHGGPLSLLSKAFPPNARFPWLPGAPAAPLCRAARGTAAAETSQRRGPGSGLRGGRAGPAAGLAGGRAPVPAGYFGRHCVDVCHLNPCEHVAACVRSPSAPRGYVCECGPSRHGQYCKSR